MGPEMTALQDAYKSIKVLVIDDEEQFRATLITMLKRLGVTAIQQSADGLSGYDELVRSRPDIVLCDVHMTPVDGQEFLHRVRESDDPAVRDVAMIFLSGDNQLDTVRGAMRYHADGYLVKPFKVSDLRQQLDITITLLAQHARAKRA